MWETQGIHKRVVSETLFMTGNAEKQHKGPSIKDWWKKLWCIHTMECSSVIKRNDIYWNSLAWKEHTIYCQVKEAVKQHLSFNPIYQNAIFKIWFVYIRLGRPLKFCSSKCQGWFSLDDRMAGVLFVYLFGGRQFFFLSLHDMSFLPQACNSLNKRQYRFSKRSQTEPGKHGPRSAVWAGANVGQPTSSFNLRRLTEGPSGWNMGEGHLG